LGKPDSTAYIQNLINTNGIAELPEGVFYISSSLNIPFDKGIIGKGTGKTVICGLTDDFPLIITTSPDLNPFGSIILSYITLQGGSDGLLVSNPKMMMSYQSMKYVTFRNQANGIHLFKMYGLDNNFFEHISFINCTKGIFQDADPIYDPSLDGTTYMDKTVFYKCQFINCDTSMSLYSIRASNLNMWVDCKFDGGNIAVGMNADKDMFVNCDFSNFTGEHTLIANTINLLSCKFYNNANTKSTLNCPTSYIEDCNFLDNIDLGYPNLYNPTKNYIFNSTITGNAIVPIGVNYSTCFSTFVNSNLLSNPTFSKLLVTGVNNIPKVLLDITPNPYPQFLVNK
jgi:hypothetical protein